MKKKSLFNIALLLLPLLGFSATCQALTEAEAEDLADLTAVFFYLKRECGYNDLPVPEIKRALVYFAQQNRWDLSNYDRIDMEALGQSSYSDLSQIPIAKDRKCEALAKDSFGVMNYKK
ncbi:YacC family pilotin-like protein [Budvicia diplopodorum]|uniref:YacC family pilotin-like protein n=1 Tax=Budvicia diplopodorum TaxID=1119056 RepID=UPI00135687A5|nr:YacC family pilotin-like protein [Budvicia diplopodorum]